MKTSTSILLAFIAILTSCTHSEATPKDPTGSGQVGSDEVRCEVAALERSTDADWTASFRVDNGTGAALSYVGFGKDAPLYSVEVLEAGVWTPYPMGWCGTGSSTLTLEPGESQIVKVNVPADGRSYRYRFGEPAVVTPAVSAKAK